MLAWITHRELMDQMLPSDGNKAKVGDRIPTVRRANPIAARLFNWYDANRRILPWRAPPGECADPYAVWLSEIMLQQTGVATVARYYESFLTQWPTVEALAQAPIEALMRAWAGLGYYQRARNLHACAQLIAFKYGGQFPDKEEQLRQLPGIGAYAAAAIAAIAFNRRAIVIDGNIERVICRLFAVEPVAKKARREIRALAETVTPGERPGDFAQAMMDLGATICTPRRPSCIRCPLKGHCRAHQQSAAEQYPRKQPRPDRLVRAGALFYIRRADGAVLVRTRAPTGLLGGMTEIPGTDWRRRMTAPKNCPAPPKGIECLVKRHGFIRAPGQIHHVFTHFSLHLTVFVAGVDAATAAPADCRWVHEDSLESEALPTLMRKAIAHAKQGLANERVPA
jgi:A/G-specific adenine glycosylase